MGEDRRPRGTDYVTVEIYDQAYHLSGQDPEHVRALAARVDAKMRAVAAQGKTVDSLRVAVLAALNLADELSQAMQSPQPAQAQPTHASYVTPPGAADIRIGHARAQSLRGLLDEVLEGERKTGS